MVFYNHFHRIRSLFYTRVRIERQRDYAEIDLLQRVISVDTLYYSGTFVRGQYYFIIRQNMAGKKIHWNLKPVQLYTEKCNTCLLYSRDVWHCSCGPGIIITTIIQNNILRTECFWYSWGNYIVYNIHTYSLGHQTDIFFNILNNIQTCVYLISLENYIKCENEQSNELMCYVHSFWVCYHVFFTSDSDIGLKNVVWLIDFNSTRYKNDGDICLVN